MNGKIYYVYFSLEELHRLKESIKYVQVHFRQEIDPGSNDSKFFNAVLLINSLFILNYFTNLNKDKTQKTLLF